MRRKLLPLMLATLPLFATEASLNATQKQEVKDLIKETLKSDPKIIINSIVEFRKQQMQQYQQEAEKNIAKHSEQIFDQNTNLVLGNPKAKVSIIEFMDYNCGHCKALAKTLESLIKNNKDVKVIVKDLPLFGESSMLAAKASVAASKQNKFSEFHYAIFALKKAANKDNIKQIAEQLKLDMKKFDTDLNSSTTEDYIKANIALAKNLRIMATPAMIIGNKTNNKFVAGAIPKESINEIIGEVK